jgi:hypothetical protein
MRLKSVVEMELARQNMSETPASEVASGDPRGGEAWYFFIGSKIYRDSHPVKEYVSHVRPLPTPGRMTGRLPN